MGDLMSRSVKLLDASEMICSLRFEDVRGCPYDAFTPRGIAALACTISLTAAMSLLFGV